VGIEWDPVKAKANLRKHGIDFADALPALEDENALTIPARPATPSERRQCEEGR